MIKNQKFWRKKRAFWLKDRCSILIRLRLWNIGIIDGFSDDGQSHWKMTMITNIQRMNICLWLFNECSRYLRSANRITLAPLFLFFLSHKCLTGFLFCLIMQWLVLWMFAFLIKIDVDYHFYRQTYVFFSGRNHRFNRFIEC